MWLLHIDYLLYYQKTGCQPLNVKDIQGCDCLLSLLPQADKGHWQALRVLTETAAYVDMQDAAGRSVLYLAAQKGYARCVEVLLAQGASCLLNDNRLMWTPIHVAGILLSAGRFDCIVLFSPLIVSILCYWEYTYVLFLILSPVLCFVPASNGHSDCLRMMIDYGEEGDLTNVADKFGQWVFFFEKHGFTYYIQFQKQFNA